MHAVTDVTGYGLAGHGWEMSDRSGARLIIDSSSLPLYEGAHEIAASGHRTGGDPRNRAYVADRLTTTADDSYVAICMDQQTSAESYMNGQVQGAMTCILLEVLKTDPRARGNLHILITKMRQLLSLRGYAQVPKVCSTYDITHQPSFV